ncbi:hypothetical protein NL676_000805 [Syzygium grande]|nr:hypothetical protein NL676_000805 [Syzygium grande]
MTRQCKQGQRVVSHEQCTSSIRARASARFAQAKCEDRARGDRTHKGHVKVEPAVAAAAAMTMADGSGG